MFQELKQAIAQLATFMICAQAIEHFRPRAAYEKYLKMLISVMILVQIFQPFCSFFFGGSSQEFQDSVQKFQIYLDESMEDAALRAGQAEEKLEQMSLLELQERMEREQENAEIEQDDAEIQGEELESREWLSEIEKIQIEVGAE